MAALSPIEVVDANLRDAMSAYACATPQGEVRVYPGLVVSSCGINYSVFNAAMFPSAIESAEDLDRRLAQAAVHFAARGLGWSCWICEHRMAPALAKKLDAVFSGRGLRALTSAPGMYAQRISGGARSADGVHCEPVLDAKTRFDFCDVACVVFSLPFRIAYSIYAEPGYWTSGTRGYVAYVNRKPVAIVSTVLAGGAIGVYSLGTLPQHRRRGFGETIMRYALDDARASADGDPFVLQATDSGFPLYTRMGYRSVTRFRIYEFFACGTAK